MIRLLKWIKELYINWREDRIASLAAALAYYTMFSLVPILIICITIAGTLLGEEAARSQVIAQIDDLVGKEAALEIQGMIHNATHQAKIIKIQIISVLILIFSASGIFSELQEGLNAIWGVKSNPHKEWFVYIKNRFISFIMVLISAFLLLISIVITTLLATLSSHIPLII